MKKEVNKKLKALLKKNKKSVYGLSKALGIKPQGAEYLVKEKDLSKDYNRLKTIAEYLECEIKEII